MQLKYLKRSWQITMCNHTFILDQSSILRPLYTVHNERRWSVKTMNTVTGHKFD